MSVRRAQSAYAYREGRDVAGLAQALAAGGEFPLRPLAHVELQPATACNLRCRFCFGKHVRPEAEVELSRAVIRRHVLEPTRALSPRPFVPISGLFGDPSLHSDLDGILADVGGLGFRFGLYTNGLLLEPAQLAQLAAVAVADGGRPSYVSFDISALLQVGRLDDGLARIRSLARLRDPERLQINAPVLLTEGIELEPLHAALLDAGCDFVRYALPITPADPASLQARIAAVRSLSAERPEQVFVETKRFRRCYAMLEGVNVSPWGDVLPCSQTCSPAFRDLVLGSILDQPITAVWQGAQHRKLYADFDPSLRACQCNAGDRLHNELAQRLDPARRSGAGG